LNYINKLLLNDDTLLEQNIIKKNGDNYILNSKYKIGQLNINKNIAFIQLENLSKIFIEFEKLNGAYDNDIVLIQIIFNPRSKLKAKVIKIIEQNNSNILVVVKEKQLYSIKEQLKLDLKIKLENYKDGDLLLIKENKVNRLFGNVRESTIDEKISLYLYEEEYRVKKYITDEVYNIDKLEKNRVDLTHLPFCTIDPVDAKDFDDAIYFDEEQKILYVAIADVSAFIKEGSRLDIEAQRRGYSIYLPNKVLPMIPFELSNDLCSLKPNIKRLAFVFQMQLDTKNLTVTNSKVFEAVIVSQNRFTYEDIDNKIKSSNLSPSLFKLYTLTKKLRTKRLAKGFDFRTQELRLKLNTDEKLIDINEETSTPSHQLIEECMLLANIEASKRLKNLGIYRVHEEPTMKKIQTLIDDVNMLGLNASLKKSIHSTIVSVQTKALNKNLANEIDQLIIQSQQQARYSSTKLGHFGLGFDDYSHFTSPIRRYADLVLHRILKIDKLPKDIDTICEDISEKERQIALLVWDLEDRKYARWAKENIENIYNATIIDIKNGIVKLTNGMKGARVMLINYQGEKLFTKIKIKITSSDILTKKIEGEKNFKI
jgi:ribonuclease R